MKLESWFLKYDYFKKNKHKTLGNWIEWQQWFIQALKLMSYLSLPYFPVFLLLISANILP